MIKGMKIINIEERGADDSWAEVELYRWQHGELPPMNERCRPLDIPAGLLGMAQAIEVGVKSGDMTPENFPSPMNVVEVLRYAARHLTTESPSEKLP